VLARLRRRLGRGDRWPLQFPLASDEQTAREGGPVDATPRGRPLPLSPDAEEMAALVWDRLLRRGGVSRGSTTERPR
jgi:hypothetical protein